MTTPRSHSNPNHPARRESPAARARPALVLLASVACLSFVLVTVAGAQTPTTVKRKTSSTTTTVKKKTASTTTVKSTRKPATTLPSGDPDGVTTTVAVTAPTNSKPKSSTTVPTASAKPGIVFIPGAGRVLDLDANQVAKLAAGGKVEADVRGANGLAASGTGSVIVDVTVSNPTTNGKVTLTPVAPDFARTVVNANLSFPASATTVTRLSVPVGSGGKVRVATTPGPSGLAISVVGWVVPAPAGTVESSAIALEPCRLLDTTSGVGGLQGEVTPARPFDLPVVSVGKVPAALGGTQVPTGVIVNVGAANASGPLEVTAVPSGSQSPALVLSMAPQQTTSGNVVIPVGSDARAAFFVSQNGVQLTVDVLGWLDRDGVAKTGGPC